MRAELLGGLLHLLRRGPPAAVHRGQHMHRVVAGAEEDAAPQIADGVAAALPDTDDTAAGPDTREVGGADPAYRPGRELRQDGDREQRLEGAGRGELAVRALRAEHAAGVRVGHHPGQRGQAAGQPGRTGGGGCLHLGGGLTGRRPVGAAGMDVSDTPATASSATAPALLDTRASIAMRSRYGVVPRSAARLRQTAHDHAVPLGVSQSQPVQRRTRPVRRGMHTGRVSGTFLPHERTVMPQKSVRLSITR